MNKLTCNYEVGINEVHKEFSWNEKELEEFRKIVLNNKQLKCRTDDIFLLSFLRARKYDRERAFKLLKNYYSIRKNHQNVFKDLKPSVLENCIKMNMMTTLRTMPDKVIGVGRVDHWDPTKLNVFDVGRTLILFLDLELNYHPIQVHGLDIIIDAKAVSWRHFIQFSPKIIRLALSCLYQSFPISYKSLHFVNVNKYLQAIVALAFPFIPYKIKKRFHFHGSNMEALHKEFDPKYLPLEFGGELPSFDCTEQNQRLLDNEDFFIQNEKYWNEDKSS